MKLKMTAHAPFAKLLSAVTQHQSRTCPNGCLVVTSSIFLASCDGSHTTKGKALHALCAAPSCKAQESQPAAGKRQLHEDWNGGWNVRGSWCGAASARSLVTLLLMPYSQSLPEHTHNVAGFRSHIHTMQV